MTGKKLISLLFLLLAIEAAAAIFWLGSMPAEAGNALAFGYSTQRLLLMGGLILPGLFCLMISWRTLKSSQVSSRVESFLENPWVLICSALATVAAWILFFSPAYQWGQFSGYRERLLPVVLWLLFAGIQICSVAIIIWKRSRPGSFQSVILTDRGLLKGWGIGFGVVALIVLFIALFRIGLIPDIVYWNDFNVPILGIQIIGVVSGSILILGLLSNVGFFPEGMKSGIQRNLPDLVICLLLWGLAVLIWTRVEMPRNYFAPGPYPPNNEMYPFSDAVGYERAAMNALIGEGLGSKIYIDKPIYVAFLAIIHMLVGNQMNSVVGLQVAVIALLPVMLYLLGRRIHSRLAGLMTAAFFIFREMNNIQGTLWVLSTNSRLIMSESLVGLTLALFVFFLTRWVSKKQYTTNLIAAGGALGLASLVRLNPLIVMPITIVGIWLVCWKQWKTATVSSLIFFAMFLGTLMPWMLQSQDRNGKILYFMSTMHGVVYEQRTYYALNTKESVITDSNNSNIQPSAQPTSIPTPAIQKSTNRTWNRITGIAGYVSGHFFHNMIDGIAIFPTNLTLDSLENTIKAPGSYWKAEWEGSLTPDRFVMLILSLATLALGLAAAWSRYGLAGLVPAGLVVAYSLATAVVRTSSGRYFIPVDWIFLLYFAIGIAQVVVWVNTWLHGKTLQSVLISQEESKVKPVQSWSIGIIICLFIFIGAIPVMFDRFIPQRYQTVDKDALTAELSTKNITDDLDVSKEQLKTFLHLPDAVVYRGMGLYPRFYLHDKGEPDRFSAFRVQAFPRLVIDVIGPAGNAVGVLPLNESPESLPNGSEVLAIGCRGELNDDWLALVVGDQVYLRSPATKWTCPVTIPVCDNNRVCQ